MPAHGGRFVEFACDVLREFVGRFELPNPWGARPESVLLPCADQERMAPLGRLELLRDGELACAPCCVIAEGGRLAEICAWRFAFRCGWALLIEWADKLDWLCAAERFAAFIV